MEPKVVIDGIFFQIANSGIARVWSSILKEWSECYLLDGAVIIDRDKTCPKFDSFKSDSFIYEDMPRYNFSATAKDAFAVEEICQKHQADLFISTYYTMPISTPSLMMVHDMIPEKFNFDMSIRGWQEKTMAIHYANGYICVSHNTAKDLGEFYPKIPDSSIMVAHNGINHKLFYPRSQELKDKIRNKYGITKDYYLFVGSRSQIKGYKNARLFFESLAKIKQKDFSIVCIGGDSELEDYIQPFTSEIDIHLHRVDDEELSIFYSDAIALVYPSLYEGFGLPIIESMACGTPVITTREGSIPEASGEAAYCISGRDREEMAQAIINVRKPEIRQDLIGKGLEQAAKFSWKKTANQIYDGIMTIYNLKAESKQPKISQYWHQYRQLLQKIQ